MRIILNKHTCLVLLALIGLLENNYGQAPATAPNTETAPLEQHQSNLENPWTVVPAFSWSFFNKGRDSWQRESVDLYYYLANEKLLLGASVDAMQRPPSGDDVMYSLNASWQAFDNLELHGEISLTPDADFLPDERYSLGLKYKVNQQLGLLFDVEQMDFDSYAPTWDDGITQVKPGISYWFNEDTFATLRYTHGWVHNESDFDYFSASVSFGDLPRDGLLTLGLAYGTDPDLDFGTNSTGLSDAYIFNIFYKEPISDDLSIFAGVEYVYRLRPDNNRELYQMWTPTIGLSWKF